MTWNGSKTLERLQPGEIARKPFTLLPEEVENF
jgi:hypothetical protein